MNTSSNLYSPVTEEKIMAAEVLYQQALCNDEKFHVLRDIREAINKLKMSIENKTSLSVDRIL